MAFLSVPVNPDCQFWFTFILKRKTYTRLCLRKVLLSISAFKKNSLDSVVLTPGTALLQYVDDLMICSPTQ